MPGQVFARIILDRVRHPLLDYQRPEQSGFTPKRSTIDSILSITLFAASQMPACGSFFLTLILLTRFSQRGSLVSGGGQWADHVPRGCSRLSSISRGWGWVWHLPGGCQTEGPLSTGGKWTQRHAVLAHAPIPDLSSQMIYTICVGVATCPGLYPIAKETA